MLKLAQIQEIIDDITYKDWDFVLLWEGSALALQVQFDSDEGRQYGRKWLLSLFMPKSEIVTTVLKAILTCEEHEARENFRYKGKRIFGPHLDVDKLVELAKYRENLDLREPVNAGK